MPTTYLLASVGESRCIQFYPGSGGGSSDGIKGQVITG